ncbi:hypothetical protein D3C81_516010 [compost metagenome]
MSIESSSFIFYYLKMKPSEHFPVLPDKTNTTGGQFYSMKFIKSAMLIVMAFTLFFGAAAPDYADARRSGGGFKSGVQGYKSTPNKSTQSSTYKSDSTKSSSYSGTSATTAKRGFFSGGSFFKGMMIGGLAGMLFGGLFGGMGFFGNILGFAVNMLAIYLVVMLVLSLFRRRNERRRYEERSDRY